MSGVRSQEKRKAAIGGNRRHAGGVASAMANLLKLSFPEGTCVRVIRLIGVKCPETLGVGSEGVVRGWVGNRVSVEMYHGGQLAYLADELERLP